MNLWLNIRNWLHCFRHGHDLVILKHLNILAHIRCAHCGGEWCYNRIYDGAMRWSPAAEEFFARRLQQEG